jgi:adenine-specific DNA-methyltransferase
MRAADTTTDKAFHPCREESVEFDTTSNLFIEGDNLEVLKLLQKHYREKIACAWNDQSTILHLV